MANPAPTINQINAFNATQGTTIDFNIIGGTELVRSNRIYIYDLSDNSLICTHLYVSTESIHELPSNTDGSIVYESGKSSADFVNGTQYYAQIQTYTDTVGTEGGSGLSVAKMFWCLVDPTLTITTIPSTISTTSYNVSATYDANTSVVSNIIQQYQFSLYSATGSLLQSSGVIVGSGTQQGTSTAYDISYNFTGLSVGSSYYVVVDVTTTQGMSVSTQSGTFTVSIDTPTLGEATVVNNACDGYISVTSNLSGEYGGSGSGEIVSFETDSENVFTKLQVDLEPVQDLNGYDKPWVGGAGKNKWDEQWENGRIGTTGENQSGNGIRSKNYISVSPSTQYHGVSGTYTGASSITVFYYDTNKDFISLENKFGMSVNFTTPNNCYYMRFNIMTSVAITIYNHDIAINYPSTVTTYSPYSNICPISGHDEVDVTVSPTTDAEDGTTYNTPLGQTVYGGTLDLVSGKLVVTHKMLTITGDTIIWVTPTGDWIGAQCLQARNDMKTGRIFGLLNNRFDSSEGYVTTRWNLYAVDGTIYICMNKTIVGDNITSVNNWFANNPTQVVYPLATPLTYQLTPQQIETLVGQNNVWSEQGDVEVTYNIPITNLLVKRQDVDDVSGDWLTLYSQPVSQASDMDFTFIDFTNQYGKTYKYALVPLLTQTQSGVEVEVEGGYTVSDEVQSVFDGVFIADSTGSQKCKANVGYGNVDMNQTVGTITPIGAKYPVVITNSQNQYHNGSISGTIVPDDYYFNGNLSRIDMVNKRDELEQFLTNKRAKIIKDWNGKIWLVMIMDNVSCTFNNNYGMGIVNFSTNWVEVGDPTNQQDLQATGLINVGGV